MHQHPGLGRAGGGGRGGTGRGAAGRGCPGPLAPASGLGLGRRLPHCGAPPQALGSAPAWVGGVWDGQWGGGAAHRRLLGWARLRRPARAGGGGRGRRP